MGPQESLPAANDLGPVGWAEKMCEAVRHLRHEDLLDDWIRAGVYIRIGASPETIHALDAGVLRVEINRRINGDI